jgi:hypothetical protein
MKRLTQPSAFSVLVEQITKVVQSDRPTSNSIGTELPKTGMLSMFRNAQEARRDGVETQFIHTQVESVIQRGQIQAAHRSLPGNQ